MPPHLQQSGACNGDNDDDDDEHGNADADAEADADADCNVWLIEVRVSKCEMRKARNKN